jgi:hypothetical protein
MHRWLRARPITPDNRLTIAEAAARLQVAPRTSEELAA